MRREGVDLPVELGPCSNGEYDPVPLTPVAREAQRRARLDCDDHARRTGMSRRRFLSSLCGAATTLLAINACSEESARETVRHRPGSAYSVPTTAAVDPDAARAALAGDEFVFDLQGHFLDYSVEPGTRQGSEFWSAFPQRDWCEADPRLCFSVDHLQANLDAMSDAVARYPIIPWKVFTNFPDLYDGSGNAWRLDDGDPALARVGDAFLRHAVELGVPTVAAHKGLSTTLGYPSAFVSPLDVGPATRAHPDVRFLVYHSGFEADGVEGPFDPGAADNGSDRLIASMQASGITEPGRVRRARHHLVVAACYPAVTDDIKRKVLGLNALKLHDGAAGTAHRE